MFYSSIDAMCDIALSTHGVMPSSLTFVLAGSSPYEARDPSSRDDVPALNFALVVTSGSVTSPADWVTGRGSRGNKYRPVRDASKEYRKLQRKVSRPRR